MSNAVKSVRKYLWDGKSSVFVRAVISAVFWICVWSIAAKKAGSSLILPAPSETFLRFFELFGEKNFLKSVGLSVLRITAGAAAGFVSGLVFAVLSSVSVISDSVITPFASIVRSTPVASFIILAMLWLGTGILPSFICALMVFPIIYTDTLGGIRETRKDYTDAGMIFFPKVIHRIKYVWLPSVYPYLYSGIKNSAGLAWKAGVAAEVLAYTPLSVGIAIQSSKSYLETVDLFAWTLTVILLSLLIEKLLTLPVRRKKK